MPTNRSRRSEAGRSSEDSALRRGLYVLKTHGEIAAERPLAAGPAAIGVVLKDPEYRYVETVSKAIGSVRHHHVAEYRALIEGLKLARRHGIHRIRVFLDSSLVVNTVNGDSKLKPDDLRELRSTAGDLVEEFMDIKLCRVPREIDSEADALPSLALGRRVPRKDV